MNVPSVDEANTYFSRHLDKSYWEQFDTEKRSAALTMAAAQIDAVTGGRECNEAVFEQAVYLLRNHETQASGRVVVSQSLDGLGSQSFQYIAAQSGRYANIAPDAVRLIRAALSGMIRFSRG